MDRIAWDEPLDMVILTEVLEHFNFHPVPTLEASLQAADLSRESVEASVIETVTAQFLSVRAARSLRGA